MPAYRFRSLPAVLLAVAVPAFGPAPKADADVIRGASTADGASVSLTFTPLIGPPLTAGPVGAPTAAGVAPAPYITSDSAAVFPLPLLSATFLNAQAASNVTPPPVPGARYADADASDTNVSLGAVSFFPAFPTLLTLTLADVRSTASVTGDFPVLTPAGSTTLTGGVLTIPGFGPIVLSGSPAPNTQLSPIPGVLSVLLNEQTVTGNGTTFERIEVNGIDIAFAGFPVSVGGVPIGTLSGDFIFAHSEAELQAIPPAIPPAPEPATLVPAGIGTLLLILRRRRGRVLAPFPPGQSHPSV